MPITISMIAYPPSSDTTTYSHPLGSINSTNLKMIKLLEIATNMKTKNYMLFFIGLLMPAMQHAQSYIVLNKKVEHLEYCTETERIIASVYLPENDAYQIEVINPLDGSTESVVPLSFEPWDMKLSKNSEYLFVSSRDESVIKRYTFPEIELDIDIALDITFFGIDVKAFSIETFNHDPKSFAALISASSGIALFKNDLMTDTFKESGLNGIEISNNDSLIFSYSGVSTGDYLFTHNISNYQFEDTLLHHELVDPSQLPTDFLYYQDKLYFEFGTIVDVNQVPYLINESFPAPPNYNTIAISPTNNKLLHLSGIQDAIVDFINLSELSTIESILIERELFDAPLSITFIPERIEANNCNNGFVAAFHNFNTNDLDDPGRLIIYNSKQKLISECIPEGDSVFFNGVYVHEEGMYLDSIGTSNSCDSSYRLELNFLPDAITIDTFATDWIELFDNYYMTDTSFTWVETAVNGCDSVIHINIDIVSSSQSVEDEISIKILPNPFTNRIRIDQINPTERLEFYLYSSTGGLMLQKELHGGTTILQTDEFVAGVYYVQVINGKHQEFRYKLVKI